MTIREETLFSEQETVNSKQLATLQKHFPQCFDKQGNFIQEKMLEIIQGNNVELSKESYSLNWLGRSYARLLTNLPPTTLINEDIEHNQKEENKNSGNLLIKGDNLEVLKHLTNAYTEQVKMIYIDPPYNTGKDGFAYNDDRKFTKEQLSELAGIDLDEAARILDFTSSASSSHSAWLTFMYPRLYIAKELLKEDGVIFISIDDNELSQLKVICDEIFGETNHLGNIVWKNVTDNNPSNIAVEHEYIVCYAREKSKIENQWKSNLSDVKDLLVEVGDDFISKFKDLKELKANYTRWFKENKNQLWPLENYKFIDFHGVYSGERGVHNPGKEGYRYDIIHPKTQKPCKEPLMGYRFPQETMNKMIAEDRIIFGQDEDKLVEIKVYAKDYKQKLSSVLNLDGRTGTNELKKIFPSMKKIFTNPKTTEIIEDLISFSCNGKGIVLDFFAGSGTTGNAVLNLNSRKNMEYQFISVQINESTLPESEAFKNGFKTIFDITLERLKRVNTSLFKHNSQFSGFKVYETAGDFRVSGDEELTLENTSFFDDVVLTDSQYHSLLTTWRLYDDSQLTDTVDNITLANYTAHLCKGRLYLIAPDFSTDALQALLTKLDEDHTFMPNKVVFYGKNFDSAKQRELSEALKSYANKKSIELDVVVRY
ncbi:site-specific DNA-methyltransferase [Marinomonas sp. GJ51-6]|uniref:site-specific DNA-methyltransferase n=1 Tax=Marinomonas sp. GJ51-6 TaxID=2992802 RepID=UPI002934A182|nr:site-specific DNA-methyltransferase [Marinomonas sp. GJ51-6]WOD09198.1 site-specific DNA-methyltransferase [Marinomonas sp. GJ51-6]